MPRHYGTVPDPDVYAPPLHVSRFSHRRTQALQSACQKSGVSHCYKKTTNTHDVVDRDVHKLHKVTNKAHNHKARRDSTADLDKL